MSIRRQGPRKRLPRRQGLQHFAIDCYDLQGKLLRSFDHLRDVLSIDGDVCLWNIVKAADGKIFSCHGYRWAWKDRKLTNAKRYRAQNCGTTVHKIEIEKEEGT